MTGIRDLLGAYTHDIAEARARIAHGSRMIDTPHGPIEYAVAGDGPSTILIVHGAGGGFDQGLDAGEPFIARGFRVVAPSRFGYLKSTLPLDASPAAQADAYALLLDALNIHRVVVLGVSAGGPSAMQFALRYPGRTAALILMVPLAYPAGVGVERRPRGATPSRLPGATKWLFDAALSSDLLFWAGLRFASGMMTRAVLGTQPEELNAAGPEEQARVAIVRDHILPITARRYGLMHDAAIGGSLPRYELEKIAVPTLVVGVVDCLYGTYEGAQYTARHIPGARFFSVADGGHLWVGHDAEVTAEVSAFLDRSALARAG